MVFTGSSHFKWFSTSFAPQGYQKKFLSLSMNKDIMNKNAFVRISRKSPLVGFSFGEKGLRLLEMKRRGFNVPDGILLSADRFCILEI